MENQQESKSTGNAIINELKKEISKVVIGQQEVVDGLLIGILSNGHILLEGVPGLAKTLVVKTLAQTIKANFQRIQFTPDLLPADIIGTMIYNPKEADFFTRKGPIFTNIVLADEINRSPAKVQSALLEAMMERQVTIGDETYKLDDPFLVLATQNPIEQEGTYPLPEAQLDRFMLKLDVSYPTFEEELQIVEANSVTNKVALNAILDPQKLLEMRNEVEKVYIDDKLINYIVTLVYATRDPKRFGLGELDQLIEFGASPRASINLVKAARAHAYMNGQEFVLPDNIHAVAHDVLRHRILLTFEAEAEEKNSDNIIDALIKGIEIP